MGVKKRGADFRVPPRYSLEAMPTFKISEYEQLQRYLDKGLEDGVQRGLLSAAYRLIGVVQNEIIPAVKLPPIFDGAYRAAWKAATIVGGAQLYNDMPYAPVIEDGAAAANIKIGRAMIDALTEWARRKGLTGHAPGKRNSPEARADARQIAWAIARSMQGAGGKEGKGIFNRDGKKGLGIAAEAAKRAPDIVREEVASEIARKLG